MKCHKDKTNKELVKHKQAKNHNKIQADYHHVTLMHFCSAIAEERWMHSLEKS